jgi:signal transduction histidine kinase
MEQELDHKRRLEALGRLTAGVAHDFNNLMAVVLQVAGQLRRRPAVAADPHAAALVDEAGLAARTGGDITRQLLAFGGRQTLRPARVDMRDYLDSIRSLLDNSAAPDAQLRVVVPASLPATVVDQAGLTAALINLVANARKAIAARPGAGSIELLVSVREPSAGDLDWPLLSPGRYLVLEVHDDGCGMSPEVVEKCVEPFFSTGDAREGGGLGLSMVQGFARQSGGDLRIASTPGVGTRVALLLPAQAAE